MKPIKLENLIVLTIDPHAKAGERLPLSQQAVAKLGQLPKLIRAVMSAYGSHVGEPFLWEGRACFEIIEVGLVPVRKEIIQHLVTTISQVEENSARPQPLSLPEAVDNSYCLELLKSISHAQAHSGMAVSFMIDGEVFEITPPSPAHFTEPSAAEDDIRFLRLNVIGVCRPTPDGHVVVLEGGSLLLLPSEQYPYDVHALAELILGNTVTYVGPAKLVNKIMHCAQPGGSLNAQGDL